MCPVKIDHDVTGRRVHEADGRIESILRLPIRHACSGRSAVGRVVAVPVIPAEPASYGEPGRQPDLVREECTHIGGVTCLVQRMSDTGNIDEISTILPDRPKQQTRLCGRWVKQACGVFLRAVLAIEIIGLVRAPVIHMLDIHTGNDLVTQAPGRELCDAGKYILHGPVILLIRFWTAQMSATIDLGSSRVCEKFSRAGRVAARLGG